MHAIWKYVAVLAAAFGVSLLLTPWVRRAATAWGIVDRPDQRRIHDRTIPRGGGVAVFAAFHVACAVAFLVPWSSSALGGMVGRDWWLRFLLPSTLLFLAGMADDTWGLKPVVKLAAQVVAASVAFAAGVRLERLFGVELAPGWDLALTVLALIAVINAFNLIDGMDGLAAGLATISAAGLALAFLLREMPSDALVVLALAGAALGFLRYNFHPASIFLGDSGSMFLGFTLGAVAISTSHKGTALATIGVPLLAIGVPAIDTLLAIWRRSVRRVFEAGPNGLAKRDLDHLHHRLAKQGLSQRRVALTLYLLNAAMVGVGLLMIAFRSFQAAIGLLAFVAGAYVIARHLAQVELWETGNALVRSLRRPRWRAVPALLYPVADAAILLAGGLLALIVFVPAEEQVWWRGYVAKHLPVLAGVPFLALVLAQSYRRVWSRARVSEYVMHAAALLGGSLVAVAVSGLCRGGEGMECFLGVMLMIGVSLPLSVGLRAFPRFVQDLVGWQRRRQARRESGGRRVVIYGASFTCTLLLRADSFAATDDQEPRLIVGLVDDDENLKGRLVHGYPVIGTGGELDRLIPHHGIREIIVTVDLHPEPRRRLAALQREQGVRVYEWRPAFTEFAAEPAGPAAASAPGGHGT